MTILDFLDKKTKRQNAFCLVLSFCPKTGLLPDKKDKWEWNVSPMRGRPFCPVADRADSVWDFCLTPSLNMCYLWLVGVVADLALAGRENLQEACSRVGGAAPSNRTYHPDPSGSLFLFGGSEMAKVKTWRGNIPDDNNWELMKTIECEDIEWGLYAFAFDGGGIKIKIAAHGRAKVKANYWTGFFEETKTMWKTADLFKIQDRPELFSGLCDFLGFTQKEMIDLIESQFTPSQTRPQALG